MSPVAGVRTFVAAWPDEATRRRLAALETELGHAKNLRLVGPTRWHVTLRFLGEVGEEQLAPLGDALVACGASQPGPVACRVGPATAWFTRVRVLQLPADGLDALAGTVRDVTEPLVAGQVGGGSPFNGHVTLARVKGRLGPRAQADLEGIPFDASFAVPYVDLVASAPSPQGHVYTTIRRAILGPRA